jgi:hypothetical protein
MAPLITVAMAVARPNRRISPGFVKNTGVMTMRLRMYGRIIAGMKGMLNSQSKAKE